MPPTLTFNTKFAYGIGQLAEGLKNSALGTFVLFYYNQVLGLPGTLAGLALAIALVFDAFTDPLAGSISDNWQGKNGRRHQLGHTRDKKHYRYGGGTDDNALPVPMLRLCKGLPEGSVFSAAEP